MTAEATISQTIQGRFVVADNLHPDIRASGTTREEAVMRFRAAKDEWVRSLKQQMRQSA